MRTCKFNTVYIVSSTVSVPTISKNYTIYISLTISINTIEQLTTLARKLAFYYNILMTGSRDNCTPIYYRTTSIMSITFATNIFYRTTSASYTEYTIFISTFCTCRSLTLSNTGCADMEAPLTLSVCICIVTVHFCLKNCILCRESHCCSVNKCYKTSFSTNNKSIVSCTVGIPHSMRCQNIILILFCRIVRNIILTNTAVIKPTFCIPNANRKTCKYCCFFNFCAYACKCNYCIVMVVDIILSLEAVSNFHTLKFPSVDIVKIDSCCYRINRCKIISNDINPVDRTCGNKCRCRRNFYANCAFFCVYNKLTNNSSNIALIITDFHNDSMNTIVQIYIRCGYCTSYRHSNICITQYAINIQFYRITI